MYEYALVCIAVCGTASSLSLGRAYGLTFPPSITAVHALTCNVEDSRTTLPSRMPTCFYGGDCDHRSAPSSERNTSVSDSWIFDDCDWPGGTVTEAWGHFVSTNNAGVPLSADISIYLGMQEGIWGAQIAEQLNVTDGLMWTDTGDMFIGFHIYELRFNLNFVLPAGRYHLGIRPVGSGRGQYYVCSTSGENGQGEPLRNDNSWFQSYFLGHPLPTDLSSIGLFGTYDFSIGLCGEEVSTVTLALDGECPGAMTARVSGASPNGRVALIRSAPNACGGQTTIPPSSPCSGTVLPVGGAVVVRLLNADGNGAAALTTNVPTAACGRVCLVALDLPTCEISNIAEF